MTSPKSVKVSRNTAVRSWTAKPILGSEFTERPLLQEVYVGTLKQRKDTSTAIQSVSAVLPGFAHLKRCSNGKVLLAPLRSNESPSSNHDVLLDEDQLKNRLKEAGFDLSLLEDEFQVMKVPAKAPRTKSQAREASNIWPVNFHPDPTIESLIDGSIFDEDHLNVMERIMSLVIQAARLETVGNEHCTGAAAVVDPEDGRILAISAAKLDQHPMWHAAMLAVDLIARLHGGGAWQLDEEGRDGLARKRADSDVDEAKMPSDEKADSNTKSENQKVRLRRIKRRYEELTPLCYPRSLSSSLSFPTQMSLETQIVRKGRRNNGVKTGEPKQEETDSNEKCGPYLCTGYWVFLLMEPCPLCAMALLHSRVARIFYGTANPSVGVLGSRTALHIVPGLNHRYRVWSGILERECRQTVEEIRAAGNARLSSERVHCGGR